MISSQFLPNNGTNRIENDENIHSNVTRQTNGNRDVLGKQKKVLADPTVVVVGNASVSPKKKLSVRDLAKAFQGKTTTVSNVPMPTDGRSRSSSVPTAGMYPFSYPTLSNSLSHHHSYSNSNAYAVQYPPHQGGGGRSRSSSLHDGGPHDHAHANAHVNTTNNHHHGDSESGFFPTIASHHHHNAAVSSSFSPASAVYTHNSTTTTGSYSHQSQYTHHTDHFSCDSTGTRASSAESGVDYSAPGTFAERASMFARLAARSQPPLPQPQGEFIPFLPFCTAPSNNTRVIKTKTIAVTITPS